MNTAPAPLQWVLVDAGAITNVDYTAAHTVRELQKSLAQRGVGLLLAHVEGGLQADLDRHDLTNVIGRGRIFDTLHEALAAVPVKGL